MDNLLDVITLLVAEFLGINVEDVQVDADLYQEYAGVLESHERMWFYIRMEKEFSIEDIEKKHAEYWKRTPGGIATIENLAAFIEDFLPGKFILEAI